VKKLVKLKPEFGRFRKPLNVIECSR